MNPSSIQSRRTPWDERALGIGTREITSFTSSNKRELAEDLRQLLKDAEHDKVRLLFTRIPSENRDAILTFQENGFRFVEASYVMRLSSLSRFTPPYEKLKRVTLRKAEEKDRVALKEIAATSFHYGRFREDPKIDPKLNALRQSYWIDDLYNQGKQISVYEADGELLSFMAWEEKEKEITFLLGGSREGAGFASYLFWQSLMLDLKEAGNVRVKALISCANLGMVELYNQLGFVADEMLIGLHCHLD